MTERLLLIEPHDPVIFRDGKPFTDGLPAATMQFPLPPTIAGAIRTRSGDNLDFGNPKVIEDLLKIHQVGPFLACFDEASGKWQLAFPAPADAAVYDQGDAIRIEPLHRSKNVPGGCDLPDGLQPLFPPKPDKASTRAPRYWRAPFFLEWLRKTDREPLIGLPREIGFDSLPEQKRVHVAIEESTLLAKDRMLFTTAGLEFAWPVPQPAAGAERVNRLAAQRAGIVSRVLCEPGAHWPRVAPLGGERRLALWRELSSAEIDWPQPVKPSTTTVRLVLVTPAVFKDGWCPDWCSHGHPPGTDGLHMKLIAAAVPRFQPVSGWDLQKRGPKATRFLAPAGSVYYFECSGDPSALWMKSICDRPEDRRDGFGIVVIGACQNG